MSDPFACSPLWRTQRFAVQSTLQYQNRQRPVPASHGPVRHNRSISRNFCGWLITAFLVLCCGQAFSQSRPAHPLLEYGPRLLVGVSLLAWGVLAPEQQYVPVLVLAPGAPAFRDERAGTRSTALALATLLVSTAGPVFSSDPLDSLTLSSTVIGTAYCLRTYLKAQIQRPRPWADTAPGGDPEMLQSFPSGHALLVWAGVGDVLIRACRGTSKPWVLAAAGAGATAASVLRVASGEHYLGDVVAGALIGFAVGACASLLSR